MYTCIIISQQFGGNALKQLISSLVIMRRYKYKTIYMLICYDSKRGKYPPKIKDKKE